MLYRVVRWGKQSTDICKLSAEDFSNLVREIKTVQSVLMMTEIKEKAKAKKWVLKITIIVLAIITNKARAGKH